MRSYFSIGLAFCSLLLSTGCQKKETPIPVTAIRVEAQAIPANFTYIGVGESSQIEVQQAIVEVKNAMVQVEKIQVLIAEMENLLCVLIGSSSLDVDRERSLEQIALIPAVPAYLPSEILNQRPDIRAAEQRLIAANAQIDVAKAKFFPQLSLSGLLGTQSSLLDRLFSAPAHSWEYGASLLQEVFAGGKWINNLHFSEAVQREALHEYVSTVQKAFQEVNNALTAHQIYLQQVETEKASVEALRCYLNLANLSYSEGQIDYLAFLDAERQFFQSQLELQAALGNSFQSLVQIYQALGGNWVLEADANAVASESK